MKKISLIALCFLFIDQLIKFIIVNTLKVGEGIVIIKNFFTLTLLNNTGAAFSILKTNTFFLIIISFIALILLYLFFIKPSELEKTDIWLYGALIGGIIGNLCDRIFRGYVIDYLDFNVLNFPVFNFADLIIVVSVIFIIIKLTRREKNGV